MATAKYVLQGHAEIDPPMPEPPFSPHATHRDGKVTFVSFTTLKRATEWASSHGRSLRPIEVTPNDKMLATTIGQMQLGDKAQFCVDPDTADSRTLTLSEFLGAGED